MNSPPRTLFVFTKEFPYGNSEQYIVDEVGSLSGNFEKVVFIPGEYFGDRELKKRPLPANCEVLLLNDEAAKVKKKRKLLEIFSVYLAELIRARKKMWVLKKRKRYLGVLMHQAHLATVFSGMLQTKYDGQKHFFYCYWLHNSSVLLGLLKRRGEIKSFVCRGHAIDLYEWDWASANIVDVLPYFNFIIRQTAKVISISQHGVDYLKKRFPDKKDKFICSRLGVNYFGVNPFEPSDTFTIVSCSYIGERKKIYNIAHIVATLKVPVRWIHFGNGPDVDTKKIENVIAEFPLTAKAELRGFTPNSEIKKFYAATTVNLFINMSDAEGIPVSLMEAISFGIPVMATNVNGNPEIANEITGFGIPLGLPFSEAAKLIDDFAENIEEQKSKRKAALAFFYENFEAKNNFKKFADELLNYPN